MMTMANISKEIVYAKTLDGWDLRIFHYIPSGGPVFRSPVILCHGLAANKNSCDFGEMGTLEWERYSLAAYLTQERPGGEPVFDIWVPELRGCGHPTFDPGKHPEKYRWCFDDYVDIRMCPRLSVVYSSGIQTRTGLRLRCFGSGKAWAG
jgi:pimeloyl-ACP methyl ester carboxylesterase